MEPSFVIFLPCHPEQREGPFATLRVTKICSGGGTKIYSGMTEKARTERFLMSLLINKSPQVLKTWGDLLVNSQKPQQNTTMSTNYLFYILALNTFFCNALLWGSSKFFAFLWAYRSIGLCGSKRAKKLFRIAKGKLFCNLIKMKLDCKKTVRLFYYISIIFLAHGVNAKKKLRYIKPPLTSAVYYKQQFT